MHCGPDVCPCSTASGRDKNTIARCALSGCTQRASRTCPPTTKLQAPLRAPQPASAYVPQCLLCRCSARRPSRRSLAALPWDARCAPDNRPRGRLAGVVCWPFACAARRRCSLMHTFCMLCVVCHMQSAVLVCCLLSLLPFLELTAILVQGMGWECLCLESCCDAGACRPVVGNLLHGIQQRKAALAAAAQGGAPSAAAAPAVCRGSGVSGAAAQPLL